MQRVLGVSFDHMHMGDLLREVSEHPDAEIAGVFDPDPTRMASAIETFSIPPERVFSDLGEMLSAAPADLAILGSAPSQHASHVDTLAKADLNVMVEKPFAANVGDARRMIEAMNESAGRLAINWPLAWYPPHITAKRLLDAGEIGDLIEVHHYGGNRGPLYHLADKVEVTDEEVARRKPDAWWYKQAAGGGSLLDYLGYGATLGTWFMDGEAPLEVTCVVDDPPGLEVDEHSIAICRYARGLSKMETRWGTFTDPWTHQTQPKCGFTLVGSAGTIASYDYEDHVTIQTRSNLEAISLPVDTLPEGRRGPVEYMLARIEDGAPIEGPLDPEICLTAQRIVDSAVLSAEERRTVSLVS